MPLPLAQLTPVDLVLLLLIALYALGGHQQGWLLASADLACLALALYVGLRFYLPLADQLMSWTPLPAGLAKPAALLALWTASDLVCNLVVRGALSRPGAAVRRTPLGRLLGVPAGLARGLLVATVLLTIGAAVPFPEPIAAAVRNSVLAAELRPRTTWLAEQIGPVFGEGIDQAIGMLTVRPESDERIALPFRVQNALIDADAEMQMLGLLNRERETRGLAPLQLDPALRDVARQHSRDMFQGGYFAHIDPEGATPFDRMKAGGVSFRAAGENLALAPNVEVAHNGLMNSPGHRENILHGAYGRVGIGIADGGLRGKMVTQDFAD
jgi:uncharacterized membrane protein required for colicin V production